jgi:hypothetical protein
MEPWEGGDVGVREIVENLSEEAVKHRPCGTSWIPIRRRILSSIQYEGILVEHHS